MVQCHVMIAKLRNYLVGKFLQYGPKALTVPLERFINNRLILIPAEQLEPKYVEALTYLKKNDSLGDYLEFGVFRGTSLLCMHRALQKMNIHTIRSFGFDSFEGLPEVTDPGDRVWHKGQFKFPLEETRKNLDDAQVDWSRTFLIKGFFTDTLNAALIRQYKIKNAAIIMIDCDMYASAKEALNFCAPLIQKEAIIFFDDWTSTHDLAKKNVGEKQAFDEFLKEHTQFTVKDFGSYYPTKTKEESEAKIFLVTRKA